MYLEDVLHGYRQLSFVPKRRFYGKAVAFSEKVRSGRRSSKIGTVRLNSGKNFRLHLDLETWMQRQIFYFNAHEEQVAKFLQRRLKPGNIVVDVGANIGFFALMSSQLVDTAGEVFAFEPTQKYYDKFLSNTALNSGVTNIRSHKMALGSSPGEVGLSVDTQSAYTVTGTQINKSNEIVAITTLDEFFSHDDPAVSLIKIDVDGWDFEVLRGARKTIEKNLPDVVTEVIDYGNYEPLEIFDYLHSFDYRLYFERDLQNAINRDRFQAVVEQFHGFNLMGIHPSNSVEIQ